MFWDEETRLKCVELFEIFEEKEDRTITEAWELSQVTRTCAFRWLGNPSKYDPWIDEIAVGRALEGDRKVYDNLTVWEKRVFFNRLNKERRDSLDWEWAQRVESLRRVLDVTAETISKGLSRANANAA